MCQDARADRVNVALGDRYRIKGELGHGGMAAVYLAEDLKHRRPVAVKVLKPELAATIGHERFLKEIEIAAHLNHPHILALIDSGSADGFLYYVMPVVEGGSLRNRLNQEKQLAVEDALRITEQVGAALDYAHRQGILHRDVKPENIFLHEGEALVADFGIALALDTAGAERLTETGLAIGTPAYMSPEQVTADRPLDARTDVYSLACVTYELLVGEPPYTGATAHAVFTKRLSDPVPSARRLREAIPASVEIALKRALAKLPTDRFATAPEFTTALRVQEPAPDGQPTSIVVLPFANVSPDLDNEYFADGLTDELIAELSKIKALRVISRTSAMLFKGAQKSVPAIGKELNARYAVEGTVRRAGNSVRITAQLLDAATDSHLWGDRYSATLEDIFDLQETLARRIAQHLKVRLTPDEERRLGARPLQDPQAYDAWLLAMQQARTFTKEGIDRAIRLVGNAVSVVGDNSLLYAALSFFHFQYYDVGISHDEATLLEAERFAAQALALNSDLPQALHAAGLVRYKRGDFQGFVRYAKSAWELGRDSDAAGFLSFLLAEVGRIREARHYGDEAVAKDPLVFFTALTRAAVDLFDGHLDAALGRLRDAEQRLAPGEPFAGWWLAQAAAYAGEENEARERFERVAGMNAGLWSDLCEFFRFALLNDRSAVRDLLGRTNLRQVARTDECYPLFLANGLARVGDTDEAFHWLERAIEWGFTNHQFVSRHDRFLEPLRGEIRFAALMARAREKEAAFVV